MMPLLPSQVHTPRSLRCAFCGSIKDQMAMLAHGPPDVLIYLCFMGCQNFPEPYKAMGLVDNGWSRVDPWQDVKRSQLRIRKSQADWRALREMGRDHEQ